ncbi:uncharacterized protein LOC119796601 [Cyprinodon tularosa]|uniref:uncharacterized protein LOC119796601 n=1 Tax=Cyprinodon tularosa TaxID=77115 RepID=UPI0018E25CCE|nr:uncharacterized protein LOC119796601 [Cyprinodon tularosa]
MHLIYSTISEKPRAKLTAKETIIPAGGSITLTCSVPSSAGWKFDWFRPSWHHAAQSNRKNEADGVLRVSEGGIYSCRGGRGDPVFYTESSNEVYVRKTGDLLPVLSVSPSWLSPGASVTLSCEVEPQSAGWRFFWYKAVPDVPSRSYSFKLLPDITNRTELNSSILHGQNHTAGYVCGAGREDPADFTAYSELKFVWSADPHPAASLSVSPDRVQHFNSDSVSLSCEGNSAEWIVKWITEAGSLFDCSLWDIMNRSTCSISLHSYHSGVYWCESGSGHFSNTVNITVQKDINGIILVSPVHPVTEGDPVTLSCRDKEQKLLSNVFFYHNNKLIHNDGREELNISAVSKSDEGFYKCEHSGKKSPQSWMAVRVPLTSPVSSSLPVLLIVGPVIGLILIILLILCCCRWSKGDAHIYDIISSAEAAGNAGEELRDHTYSLIEIKSSKKESRHHRPPEEGAVYSEGKTGAAGKSSPAAEDAVVYSEIRSVPALQDNADM